MVISDALPTNLQFTSESSQVKAQLEKQGYSGLDADTEETSDTVEISDDGDELALALQNALGVISAGESSTALLNTLNSGGQSDLLTSATFSQANANLLSGAQSGSNNSSSLLNLLG